MITEISHSLLHCKETFNNITEQITWIKNKGFGRHDVYIIIHNIDGEAFRGYEVQSYMALLAEIRGIHIIASIDHINAPKRKIIDFLFFNISLG